MGTPSERARALVAGILAGALLVVGAPVGPLAPAGALPSSEDPRGHVIVRGGGWGHGVGMSQHGAHGRAVRLEETYSQILRHYYTGVTVGTGPDVDDEIEGDSPFDGMRVNIDVRSAFTFTPDGTVRFLLDGFDFARSDGGAAVTVRRDDDQFVLSGRVVDGTPVPGEERHGGAGATLELVPDPGVMLASSESGDAYPYGRVRLHQEVCSDGSPACLRFVIAGLTLDEYLYGLAEMPYTWAIEALRAQAVAGRSYAYNRARIRRSQARVYDVFDSISDQVFRGIPVGSGSLRYPQRRDYDTTWRSAVDSTSGVVAAHDGLSGSNQVITAFYSSSSGGHTADAEYAFYAAEPFARGVPDPTDDYGNAILHSWTRCYPRGDVSAWIRTAVDTSSVEVTGLVTDVVLRGPVGVGGWTNRAVLEFPGILVTETANGAERWATMSGSAFRSMINANATASHCPGEMPSTSWLGRQVLSTKYEVEAVGTSAPYPLDSPIAPGVERGRQGTGNSEFDDGGTTWGPSS